MREHWGLFCKKLRHVAGPAACLFLAPVVSAQDSGAPYPATDDGRVRIVDHHVEEPTAVPPSSVEMHSPAAIFAPGMPAGWQNLPFLNQQKPQSLDVPNMIGDALGSAGFLSFSTTSLATTETVDGIFDIPGSGRIPKIAENNSPIPRDRFYFAFNHFNNAYDAQSNVDPNALDDDMLPIPADFRERQLHQKRFTLGIEKTLFYGDMSVEFRLPLVTQVQYDAPSVTNPTMSAVSFGTDDPNGNFSIVLKKVLLDWYSGPSSGVLTSGVGFTFPTSEGSTVRLGDAQLHIEDAGVHFSPYLAMVVTGERGWFMQAFVEVDYSTDELRVYDSSAGEVGKSDIPDLFNVDVGMGWWLYRFPNRRWFKGLAPIVEYHYSSQKQSFDPFDFQVSGMTTTSDVTVAGFGTGRDISNLTTGVHVALSDHVNARVAGVVPLQKAPNRQFDAEVVFQLDLVR